MEKITMSEVTLKKIQKMPKVELHRHVDGAVQPDLVLRMCEDQGVKINQKNPKEIADFLKISPGMDFGEVLSKFDLVVSLMQTKDDIRKVFVHQMMDMCQENIVYAELRFAPSYHTEEGLTLNEVIEAALEGIERGRMVTGNETDARLIISIPREVSPEESKKIARIALEFQGTHVVAIDLACDESKYPPWRHKEAFEMTVGTNLKRTVHAGELNDVTRGKVNVVSAVEELHADRIGHGIYVPYSPKLMRLCREKGVFIESCPVSNVIVLKNISGIKQIMLDHLQLQGVSFSINSDDPVLFNASLSKTIHDVAKAYGWSFGFMQELTREVVPQTFLSHKEKKELLTKLD